MCEQVWFDMIQHLFLGSPVSESGLQTSRPGPLRLLRATDEGSANPRGDTHLLRAGFIPPYDGKAVFFIAETRLVKASRCSFIIFSHFCDAVASMSDVFRLRRGSLACVDVLPGGRMISSRAYTLPPDGTLLQKQNGHPKCGCP